MSKDKKKNDGKTVLKSYTAPNGFAGPMNILLTGPFNDRRIQAVINMTTDEFFMSPACVLAGMSWDTSSTVLSDEELILLVEESIAEALAKFMPKDGKGPGIPAEEQIAEYVALKAEREAKAQKFREAQGDHPGRYDSAEAFEDYMREVAAAPVMPTPKPPVKDEDVAWEMRDMELNKPILIVEMSPSPYALREWLTFGRSATIDEVVPDDLMISVWEWLEGSPQDETGVIWNKYLTPFFEQARDMGAEYIRFLYA